VAAVERLEQPAPRTVRRRIDAPRRAARLPQRGIQHLRISRLEGDVDGAGIRVSVAAENALPRVPAVARAKEPALGVRAVRVSERRDVNEIRIGRMDADARELL